MKLLKNLIHWLAWWKCQLDWLLGKHDQDCQDNEDKYGIM